MRKFVSHHTPSKAPSNLNLRRCVSGSVFPSSRCAPRRLGVPGAVQAGWLAAVLALAAAPIQQTSAQPDLLVDQTLGNSPYSFNDNGSHTYGDIEVGTDSTGEIDQGDAVVTANTVYLGYGFGATGTYNLTAGAVLRATSIVLGYSGTGIVNQTNGTVTTSSIVLGASSVETSNVYNLNGGSVTDSGSVVVASVSDSMGTFNLNGGTLTAASVQGGGMGTSSTFNFNGGTLQANQSSDNFFGNFTTANVRNGGAIIGSGNGGNLITINQALVHSGIAGDNATDGGLTVIGAGVVTLNGNNTYTGGTRLNAGTLSLGSAGALGTTGTLSFNGGTLQYSLANETDYSSRFSTAANQQYRINPYGNVTFASALTSQGGSLTVLGDGVLTLAGNNTYTGGTNFAGGTLALGSARALGTTGTLSFSGGTLQYSAANQTDYSGRFSAAANELYSIDTNYQNVAFASALTSQGGSLTKLGPGTLTLAGNNTYTGGTNFAGGTLALGSARALGTTGTLSFSGSFYQGTGQFVSGTLQYSANNQTDYSGRFSQAAGQLYSVDTNGQNVTFASALTSSGGSLTKLGSGTLTLNGNNTYTGGTFINGGTLALSSAGALGTTGTVSFDGGTLQYSANNTTDYSARFSTVAGFPYSIDTNGQNVTFASALGNSFSGGLTKLGQGTLTLTGNNAYAGGTTLTGGVLAAGSPGALGSTRSITFNGGTLQYSAANQTDYSARIGLSTGAISLDTNGQSVTFASALGSSNSGGLTKLGQGTLTLTKANTYTGQTTVSQGTLAVTGGGIGASGATDNLVVDLGSAGTPSGMGPIPAPSLSLSGNGTQVFFNNAFIGRDAAGSVTQSGGTLTTGNVLYLGYSGTNATTGNGTYTLTGGTLNTHETQVGNGGIGTFNHNGGTQTVTTTFALGLNNGTGTYNLSGNGVLQASSGVVGYTGTGIFNQTGGSANLGSGGLYVGNNAGSHGTYGLGTGSGNGATLNVSGPVYIGYGGTGTFNQQADGFIYGNGSPLFLGYNAGSLGTYNLVGGGLTTGDGSTVGYAGTGVFNNTGGYDTVNGTLLLGHAAGSSGTYNLVGSDSTLQVAQVSSQGGTSTFNFDGGRLVPSANNATFFQGLTSANVRNGGATLALAGASVTIAQPLLHSTIAGDNNTDGGLSVIGSGTLTLTGANTYNGGTRVQGATLLVNNTSGSGTGSGQVTLFNGAVLGGSGTIGGSVVAQAGATVAPGAAAQLATARLTLNGTLTLQNNSLLAIKLGGTTGGSGYDQVFAGGGFTLAGNLRVSLVNGFTPALGQTFTLLDNTSVGANSGVFANAPGGLYTDAAGDTFLVNYLADAGGDLVPNDVTLTYLGTNVVPEPSAWTCLLLGAAGLGLTLRLRRRARL